MTFDAPAVYSPADGGPRALRPEHRGLLRLRLPKDGPDRSAEAAIDAPENTAESTETATGFAAVPRRFTLWVATAGGAGYAPIAPGTFGSLVGVALYLVFSALPAFLLGITLLGLAFLGIWASDDAERAFGKKDDGRIVIDEVVGQLLTLAPLVALAPPGDQRSAPWLLFGFLLFRLLDIWKPPPVGWAERRFAGGAGVMMDDVFAGIMGGGILAIAYTWVGP